MFIVMSFVTCYVGVPTAEAAARGRAWRHCDGPGCQEVRVPPWDSKMLRFSCISLLCISLLWSHQDGRIQNHDWAQVGQGVSLGGAPAVRGDSNRSKLTPPRNGPAMHRPIIIIDAPSTILVE